VIHAFLDESGTNPETPVLSVAGFYGSNNQWRKFRALWKPHSKGFHAKDSTGRFPQMCSAIERSRIDGIVVSVGKGKYKTHSNEHFRTAFGNSYSMCALLCATQICEEVHPRRVSFTLEHGQPNLSFVKGVLEEMIGLKEWRVAAVAEAGKGDFIELHPPDFLSHLNSTHDVHWLQRLFFSGRARQGHVTAEAIENVSPQVTELIRKMRAKRKAERNRIKESPA
jgi:hypothetical protein